MEKTNLRYQALRNRVEDERYKVGIWMMQARMIAEELSFN